MMPFQLPGRLDGQAVNETVDRVRVCIERGDGVGQAGHGDLFHALRIGFGSGGDAVQQGQRVAFAIIGFELDEHGSLAGDDSAHSLLGHEPPGLLQLRHRQRIEQAVHGAENHLRHFAVPYPQGRLAQGVEDALLRMNDLHADRFGQANGLAQTICPVIGIEPAAALAIGRRQQQPDFPLPGTVRCNIRCQQIVQR
ncbi:MAG TPA: hypothetical protein ENJ05_02060 [Thiotrichales bacterium]|nr:hypothetical protein [Thiotrichales bacterium]